MCRDPKSVQKLLIDAGADQSIQDNLQRSPKYYMEHVQELELPNPNRSFHGSFRSPSKDGKWTIEMKFLDELVRRDIFVGADEIGM